VTRGGGIASRAIRSRIAANNRRGTATSASWYVPFWHSVSRSAEQLQSEQASAQWNCVRASHSSQKSHVGTIFVFDDQLTPNEIVREKGNLGFITCVARFSLAREP
jgi:hypothetical protein